MFSNKFIFKIISLLLVVNIFASGSNTLAQTSMQTKQVELTYATLDIYNSRTCSRCKTSILHVDENGFEPKTHNVQNLSPLKEKASIKPKYQSCHSAISKAGYFFAGPILTKFIKLFINEIYKIITSFEEQY